MGIPEGENMPTEDSVKESISEETFPEREDTQNIEPASDENISDLPAWMQ